MDVLARYFSDTDGKVKVRLQKVLVFGHAFAETVADELWKTLQELRLPLKNLLFISSAGPKVNKAILEKCHSPPPRLLLPPKHP